MRPSCCRTRWRQRPVSASAGATPRSLQEQRQRLDGLMARLRQAGLGELPLRKLLPGEGMLICHALPRDRTACLYAPADGRKQSHIVTTAELDAAQAAADALGDCLGCCSRPSPRSSTPRPCCVSFPARSFAPSSLRPCPMPGRAARWCPPDDGWSMPWMSRRRHCPPARSMRSRASQPLRSSSQPHCWGPKVTPALLSRLQLLGWQPSLYSTPQLETGANPLRRLRCWLGLVKTVASRCYRRWPAVAAVLRECDVGPAHSTGRRACPLLYPCLVRPRARRLAERNPDA